MTYRPFTCRDCGDPLSAREVAYESPVHVEGTAGTRVRRINRYCRECHAHNEWLRQEAMRKYREETFTPEELAAYERRRKESGR